MEVTPYDKGLNFLLFFIAHLGNPKVQLPAIIDGLDNGRTFVAIKDTILLLKVERDNWLKENT